MMRLKRRWFCNEAQGTSLCGVGAGAGAGALGGYADHSSVIGIDEAAKALALLQDRLDDP
jgi:hypothetical protein